MQQDISILIYVMSDLINTQLENFVLEVCIGREYKITVI